MSTPTGPPRLTPRERVEARLLSRAARVSPATRRRLRERPIVVEGQTLDPATQTMLQIQRLAREPLIETLDLAGGRASLRRGSLLTAGRPTPVGEVRDLRIDGATGSLPARHYRPPGDADGRPLLVFFHGGGYATGDLDTHDAPCRLLCAHAGVHVLAVDYRLAPEHPFPAGHEDTLAAWRWAVAHAGELGADPKRLAVGGDSAGGNFSATLALATARNAERAPDVQLLLYPGIDFVEERPSRQTFGKEFFLTAPLIEWFLAHYLDGVEHDPRDPRLSPIHAEDLSGLAPAIVVTAGFDPLRDEGEAYAAALAAAGVPVIQRRHAGLIHGFINLLGVGTASREALVETAGTLRGLLEAPPKRGRRRAPRKGTAGA